MASDWIKFRRGLVRDGRIRIVSRKCHAESVTIIGALVTLWCLADEFADANGVMFGFTPDDIDKECGVEGFCAALPEDWINLDGEYVLLPDYQEHNGSTGKNRAQSNKRKSKSRSRSDRDTSVTKIGTREEKRREEKNNITVSNDTVCSFSPEKEPDTAPIPKKRKADPVPYKWIVDAYGELCPHLAQMRIVDDARKAGAKRLWGRCGGHRDPDNTRANMEVFFRACEDSPFLRGDKPSKDHPNWRADFEFVTRNATITKIMEGKYSD